ncbi:MAG: type II toxin-antitoxin system VapB family antitoxin [Planctomycetota bacterium]
MRTTLNVDDDKLAEAMEATGLTEKTAVIHAGLDALIALEASRRLAALGGTMPDLKPIPRRRSAPAPDHSAGDAA